MRAIWFCVGLLLSALPALVAETPESVDFIEGGFAPRGASFAVTFQLAAMTVVPHSSQKATEWTSAQGATARLEICVVKDPVEDGGEVLLASRLMLNNPTAQPFSTTLSVAIAPRTAIPSLAFERHAFFIDGLLALISESPSRGAILAQGPFGERPFRPQAVAHVESAKGECRGEMLFDLLLGPGQTQSLGFLCSPHTDAKLDAYRAVSVEKLFTEAEKHPTN